VLDVAHRVVLRGVARGDDDDSPALRNLVATGLVAERDGGYEVTPAGQIALDKGPAQWERIAWVAFGVGWLVILGDTIAGWVS